MDNSMNANTKKDNDLDHLIHHLLLLHNNESSIIQDVNDRLDFDKLIVGLTMIKYNIRSCSNQNCSCHPESTIKLLLKNKVSVDFINDYSYLKEKDISKLIDLDNYKHTTVFDWKEYFYAW